MEIKRSASHNLIAIDLDGTTLTSDKRISPRTKSALIRAIDLGHKVVIATGRSPRDSILYWKELNLTTPIVNFNGVLVHHFDAPGHLLEHQPIAGEIARAILQDAKEFGLINAVIEYVDDYYLLNEDPLLMQFGAGKDPVCVGGIEHQNWQAASTLLLQADIQWVLGLLSHIQSGYAQFVSARAWSNPANIIEITRKDVSKATGLARVAALYNMDRQQVIAFGDAPNDLEMIQWAGYGVAMGNACEEVKQVADQITATNDCDGIAMLLDDLFRRRLG
ncbi:MAG: hypothetical protein JWN30_1978 [Bacilli bacterium]|nr:hypothetical protein [Bacilli bacterium]